MKHQLIPLVASFISILPAVSLAQFTSGDDFNDPARDVSKWGTEDDTSPGSSLQEISGRLHFLADSPSAFGSFASRIWRNPAPTYAADWQAGLDVALGSLEMLEGEYVLTGLTAGNAADPGAVIRLGLFRAQLDILESISGVSVEKRGPGGSEA
ncbi:MAG: hypothetical protein FJ405_12360, partial [Verrucomicrobia bacterium]|nr:hypothetical protein [Verrucomicrobiota bacterium]